MKKNQLLKLSIALILIFAIFPSKSYAQDFWKQLSGTSNYSWFGNLTHDSKENIFLVQENRNVRKSTDHGMSWELLNGYNRIDSYYHNNNKLLCKDTILFVANSIEYPYYIGGGIFVSYNQGDNWVKMNNGLGADTNATGIWMMPNGNIMINTYDGLDAKLYMSSDNANSWTFIKCFKYSAGLENMLINPNNKDAYLFSDDTIYKSIYNSQNLTFVAEVNDVHPSGEYIVRPSGEIIAYSNTTINGFYYGVIKSSFDSIDSWKRTSNTGLSSIDYLTCMVITHGDTIYAGTDIGVYYTVDEGESWTAINSGMPSSEPSINDLYISTEGYLFCAVHFSPLHRSVNPVTIPSTGIKETTNIETSNLKIFPNPVKDYVNITSNTNIHNATIEIIDIYGRVLYKNVVTELNGDEVKRINILDLKEGVYFVRLGDEEWKKTSMFIKY